MGDRHGGRFARRGRALNPPRPQVDAHRGVGFRWRATVFRCREVVGRICPRAGTLSSAKASRHGARAKGFVPTREHAPRRRPPDTARRRKDLCRAGTRPSTKVSRHGAKAKGFAPTREGSPRRRHPDTARRRRDLPRARTLSSAKDSRHGAKEKGFVPPRNTPLGEGLPTRRTSERICPTRERYPRRRHPDTAHERKNLPHAGTLPTAKTSRHGAKAERFAPRGSRSPHVPTNGGTPSADGQPKNTPSAGSHPQHAAAAEFIHRKKIRLLHEIQLFYGESHVGSRQIFPSFPSVGRCVAREQNPVPPVAPHRGSEPRDLRRTGEMVRRFDAMCPRGGEWLPRGGRCDPGLRCFGERFHRRRCANPDACRGRRCARAHDDLGQRAFRYFRPAFRNRRRSGEKTCGGRRCSRG